MDGNSDIANAKCGASPADNVLYPRVMVLLPQLVRPLSQGMSLYPQVMALLPQVMAPLFQGMILFPQVSVLLPQVFTTPSGYGTSFARFVTVPAGCGTAPAICGSTSPTGLYPYGAREYFLVCSLRMKLNMKMMLELHTKQHLVLTSCNVLLSTQIFLN